MRPKCIPIDPSSFSPKQVARFWSKVDRSGGPDACWPWLRGKRNGYGRVDIGYVMYESHRVAYALVNGVDPGERLVLHTCDSPPCCNPAHHFLGDDRANTEDMVVKGRSRKATGLRHGRYSMPERTARGSRNGEAKLSEADVVSIRARHSAGSVTLVQLGAEYGVTPQAIWLIVHRKKWVHLP